MGAAIKPAPVASDSKTAEFAKLFDLFERLASRKARAHAQEPTPPEDIQPLPVPADLIPVVNSLAGLLGTRKRQDDNTRDKGKKARTQNVDDEDDEDAVSLAKFGLGKKYPFTFRMMLHKLYQIDDWAQKVKEVLERSKIEYKPLAETELVKEKVQDFDLASAEEAEAVDGRVHFKAGTATGSRKPGTLRPRSHSLAITIGPRARDIGSPKSPRFPAPKTTVEDTRAVKKRCVGRRKSMSGPTATGTGLIGGNWVYDAAVSAAEPIVRHELSDRAGSSATAKNANLVSLGVGQRRVKTRRVSLGTPSISALGAISSESIGRRRALSVMNNMGATKIEGRPMKRGLEY